MFNGERINNSNKVEINNDKNYDNDIDVSNDRRDSVCACALRRFRVSGEGGGDISCSPNLNFTRCHCCSFSVA